MAALMPIYSRFDVAFERGEGPFLFDESGRRYLDFGAGIAVCSLGHAHPHLVRALSEQASKLWHTSNLYRIPNQERLAQRLIEATFADQVVFNNSGAEAVETGIKLVRKYQYEQGRPERYRMITFEGAFHGRTLATIAAAVQEKLVKGFGPMVDGFDQAPLGDIDAVRALVGPQTAGILIEPVQGEGGIRVVENDFLEALREIASANDLLVMYDEVQSGLGRTGKLFAHEWSGVVPDVMAVAKGIGGGFPLGACLATAQAASGMTAGTHGTTFGGNPLAMAVGNAVLDIVLKDDFLAGVERIGNYLRQQLAGIVDRHDTVFKDLRGRGLMLGLGCHVPNLEVVEALRKNGLLSIPAGDNVVRIMPPLIVEQSHVSHAIDILDRTAEELRP